MAEAIHRFPAQQEAFLRALRSGAYPRAAKTARGGPRAVTLVDRMPPVYQQALQGTCVPSAVTALLEYHDDLRTRLSVQFLFAATKEVERNGLERNLAHLRSGEPLDAGFMSVCHAELLQLRMLADANGGMDAPAVRPYLARFEEGLRARFAAASGCLLQSCFRAVEAYGVCRYALWPYASAYGATAFDGSTASGRVEFPPGTRDDAAKRRIVHGLYLLGTPNNVDEIRGLLAGENGRRAMPVVVTVDFFAGCDGETYAIPETTTDAEGHLVAANAWQGRHGLLLVGYMDSAAFPGGGYFIIRNSLGEGWGNRGYGKLPYAYLECFAREAGTIVQDLIDYEGDGYGGRRSRPLGGAGRGSRWLLNLAVAFALVGGTAAVCAWWSARHAETSAPVTAMKPAETPALPETAPAAEAASATPLTTYKVFISCENAAERGKLREAMSREGVPYAVEFLPPTLETVLALRVKMPEGDAYEAIAQVLKQFYDGPRKSFWTDVPTLCNTRTIYIVRAVPPRR